MLVEKRWFVVLNIVWNSKLSMAVFLYSKLIRFYITNKKDATNIQYSIIFFQFFFWNIEFVDIECNLYTNQTSIKIETIFLILVIINNDQAL